MRYLVTGAAGFIGSHLAEALVAEGHDVVGIDSFNDYYDPARKRANADGSGVVEADLLDVDLDGLLADVDAVFHLAGQPGVRSSFGPGFELYVARNVHASGRLFEAAARRGARVVYASSSSVYGDAETYPTSEDVVPRPIAPYGVTKLCVEHLAFAHARTTGLDAVGLRYFTVYGPRQRPDMAFTPMLEALAAGTPFRLFGDGSVSRSFTYVADAVAGTIAGDEDGEGGGDLQRRRRRGSVDERGDRPCRARRRTRARDRAARRRGRRRSPHPRGRRESTRRARVGSHHRACRRAPCPLGVGRC